MSNVPLPPFVNALLTRMHEREGDPFVDAATLAAVASALSQERAEHRRDIGAVLLVLARRLRESAAVRCAEQLLFLTVVSLGNEAQSAMRAAGFSLDEQSKAMLDAERLRPQSKIPQDDKPKNTLGIGLRRGR